MLDDFVIGEILRREREKERKQREPVPLYLPVDEPQSLPQLPSEKNNDSYEPAIIPLGDN